MRVHYVLLLICIPGVLLAQGENENLDINDALARFYSNGLIGTDGSNGPLGYLVPAQSGISPLYAAGLWIGGVDDEGQLRIAAHTYGVEKDFYPGPLTTDGPASISEAVSDSYDRIWKINRSDLLLHHQYHLCVQDPGCDPAVQFPNYEIPDDISTWPAHGDVNAGQAYWLAPYYDFSGEGSYDAVNGDHPCVPGDQALYMIYNDNTAPHGQTLGLPIGLEVHMMPFAYTGDGSALEQTVFIHYRLINRSDRTLNNVFVGTFADGDIGCADDDFIGTDVGQNMMFFYNWSDFDPTCMVLGYGSQPPAFGVVTLKGPSVDANGMDDPEDLTLPSYNGRGFNDGIVDNERHGLSRMIYFNHKAPSNNMNYPWFPQHYYTYLQAQWKDSVQLHYGGQGYPFDPDSYVPAYFMFPGDTDTLGVGTAGIPMSDWRETQPTPNQPNRSGIASMGPFTLEPGEEDDILLAYVFARATAGGAYASVEALKSRVDSVRAFAETIPGIMVPGTPCQDLFVGVPERSRAVPVRIRPNPATKHVEMEFNSNGHMKIFDSKGTLVLQRMLSKGTTTLDIVDLVPGLYHVRHETDGGTQYGRFVKE